MNAGGNPKQGERVKVKAMIYNMSNFLKSCVDRYLEFAKCERNTLRKVATPFLDDNKVKRETDDDDLTWPLSLVKNSKVELKQGSTLSQDLSRCSMQDSNEDTIRS